MKPIRIMSKYKTQETDDCQNKTGSNRQMKVLHTQIYKSTLHEGETLETAGKHVKETCKKKKKKQEHESN